MVTREMTRNTPKSVLSQYVTQTRQFTEHLIMNAQNLEERKEGELSQKVLMWEIDVAHKYKLTPSALAMIRALPKHCTSASRRGISSERDRGTIPQIFKN